MGAFVCMQYTVPEMGGNAKLNGGATDREGGGGGLNPSLFDYGIKKHIHT